MGEEEKAARFALRFSGLEHLIPVPFGTKRVFNLVFVNRVHLSDFLELFGSILINCYFFIDGQHGLIGRAVLLVVIVDLWLFWSFLDVVCLDELIFYKVFVSSLVPLFGVLDLNPVQPTNSHQLVAFFLLKFSISLNVNLVAKVVFKL